LPYPGAPPLEILETTAAARVGFRKDGEPSLFSLTARGLTIIFLGIAAVVATLLEFILRIYTAEAAYAYCSL